MRRSKKKPLFWLRIPFHGLVISITIKVGDKVEGKSKMLTGRNGIVTKITKESHTCKFTIQWDTEGTSIESD